MQKRLLVGGVFIVLALALRADVQPARLDATVSRAPLDWKDPRWWEIQRSRSGGVSLGQSDYTLRGPLVETFRRPSWSASGEHWTRKLLNLPVVNLFVPLPMPPAGGPPVKYLAWGESGAPWSTLTSRERASSTSVGVAW